MQAATTLTLNALTPAENLQHAQFYKNNKIASSSTSIFSFFTYETSKQTANFLNQSKPILSISKNGQQYTSLPIEDMQLLENSTQISAAHNTNSASLHKSHSYHGAIKPKSTILKQDSLNGRIATSLTCSDSEYEPSELDYGTSTYPNINAGTEEHDSFLLGTTNIPINNNNNNSNSNSMSTRRSARCHTKSRGTICFRTHAFISRNWYLSYLVPLTILIALLLVAYLTRDYAKHLLYWIEKQNQWVIFGLFILLFIVVSFPIVVGYFVLMITSGYMFGCIKGFLTVILGANLGIAIAHVTLRSLRHRIPMHKLIKNETGRAILRVISGPRAFKVVLFTRLTPIPFGIQNAIFGVSSINPRVYHTATFLGLLPAQTINVYLGSTLRSMHEVLNSHGTALTGYISFCIEVVCGVALMFWVIQKARKELADTLMTDISAEGKLIDIQV